MPLARDLRHVIVIALLGLTSIGISARAALALDGHWQPPGVRPTHTPLAVVLSQIERYRGAVSAPYTETLRLVTGGGTFATQVSVRDHDVRYLTHIDGAAYGSGRANGTRWRQNPAGLVRSLQSDLQGDPLDRWPVSILPIVASDCTIVGESTGAQPHWVVQDAPARDAVHWFYVDEQNGAIDREVTREGSAVFTTAFDDLRDAAGAHRPFHWQTTGFGGQTDVFVDQLTGATVPDWAVAIPASPTAGSALANGPTATLPATFTRDRIMIDVAVNGHRSQFLLDTGTTQILMTAKAARDFGVPTVFNHGIVAGLGTGAVVFRNLPIMTVPDIFGMSGILGYDFFAGSIVHIDYRRARVDLMPRDRFTAPADAIDIPTRFDEGLPLASAAIGSLGGDRFALDTGSADVLLPRYLWEARGLDVNAIGIGSLAGSAPQTDSFLEGPVVTEVEAVPDLRLGPTRFTDVVALVEQTNSGATIDLPFDGILGTKVLAQFEWWFDYTGGHAWMKNAN